MDNVDGCGVSHKLTFLGPDSLMRRLQTRSLTSVLHG